VTLVGKGVCFDTGGLDLKPSSGMLIMKKDMGGAANVLALAQMVMDAKLKVRLRVLIPAVENAVAGNAFRPLDIFKSRKGPTVEIGNTDAEGGWCWRMRWRWRTKRSRTCWLTSAP
jgi:leucyl aminopeptidase